MLHPMLSTVRGVFREGHVELQEAAPRQAGPVLVVFLADDEPAEPSLETGERGNLSPPQSASPSGVIHAAWPRELIDQLLAEPDELIERNQPAEPERKDLAV